MFLIARWWKSARYDGRSLSAPGFTSHTLSLSSSQLRPRPATCIRPSTCISLGRLARHYRTGTLLAFHAVVEHGVGGLNGQNGRGEADDQGCCKQILFHGLVP